MAIIGRKKLKSQHARSRLVDKFFERLSQTLLIGYALFLLVAWISYRPTFWITEIVVDGARAVPPENAVAIATEALHKQFLHRINRNNRLFYPTRSVLRDISLLSPRIEHTTADFDSRHILHLRLYEYKPSFFYCEQVEIFSERMVATSSEETNEPLDCYLADAHGYVFATAPEYSRYPFPTFIASTTDQGQGPSSPIGTTFIAPEKYLKIQIMLGMLRDVGQSPYTVTLLPENDVRIDTDTALGIFWNTTKDHESSIQNLNLVLRSIETDHGAQGDLSVIDLRFGNKIFYK